MARETGGNRLPFPLKHEITSMGIDASLFWFPACFMHTVKWYIIEQLVIFLAFPFFQILADR